MAALGLVAHESFELAAGGGLHFTMWPWRLRRGLPVLLEAEGLPPRLMPPYNAVLYVPG